jgi:hypothetical protein
MVIIYISMADETERITGDEAREGPEGQGQTDPRQRRCLMQMALLKRSIQSSIHEPDTIQPFLFGLCEYVVSLGSRSDPDPMLIPGIRQPHCATYDASQTQFKAGRSLKFRNRIFS